TGAPLFRYVLQSNDDVTAPRIRYPPRMTISSSARRRRARRSGFSIVEVIVALMIVTVGLLGIAGASALALRTTLDAARRRDAVERAQSRVARLSASGCERARSGTVTDAGARVTEQWSIRGNGAFQDVTDSITWLGASGFRTFALTSAIPC
ncbi:MAG: prepilin-type N-terminal cleavage/methylation domain-containing protein, partial [Gemmatimonadota bacterium]|nr:prepilin-type N-terminal cleavage/methylation domain-containing protein [Gemmatimonadota bacterium]